jgi:hypothetical protein
LEGKKAQDVILVILPEPGPYPKTGQGQAPRSPQFGLRLAIPEGHLALNRENAAPLFWESRYLKPVWQSGAISQRKITANSGRWEAKVG